MYLAGDGSALMSGKNDNLLVVPRKIFPSFAADSCSKAHVFSTLKHILLPKETLHSKIKMYSSHIVVQKHEGEAFKKP